MNKTIRIMLVEDEAATVELLKEALSETDMDYELQVFSNGEAALEGIKEAEPLPNLLLLDLNLPGISGLEVLKSVKQSRATRMVPVIVLTNSQSPDDVVKAYASHCNAYVRKPMGFDALIEVMESTGKFWFEIAVLPDSQEAAPPVSIPPK